MRAWADAMKSVEDSCFTPTSLGALDRVNCLRSTPSDSTSAFSAHRLGFYAAGVTLSAFSDLFQSAYSASTWSSKYTAFQRTAKMPRTGPQLSDSDFATLKAWVLRGMPEFDYAVSSLDGGAHDAAADANLDPSSCTDFVSADLLAHIAKMKTEGWGAHLADLRTPMYGCGTATHATDCLTTLVDRTSTYGATGVDQKLRVLREPGFTSWYWVRSSADGRYTGFGVSDSSKIVDLASAATASPIDVAASYDPYFFPSNDGFAFAGTDAGGTRACKQSLLGDLAGTTSPKVTFEEPKCAEIVGDVYETIGSALDGTRYFVAVGDHENDDGGNSTTHPLPGGYSSSAQTSFVPMVNDGTSYAPQTEISVTIPNEGDLMLSPSSLLGATRYGASDGSDQVGYRVHAIHATTAGGTTSIDAPIVAEVCMKGGKASLSFDERFLAAHQYVDTHEPDQASLADGSSNIVLADLKTGRKVRLTTMHAKQFALYPHFRADGWLYFLIRDMGTGKETLMATDAAIRMAEASP
jgi:hypothetical protein